MRKSQPAEPAAGRLRLGCVHYLNAKPLIHGHAREVQLMPPAEIARRLADGRLAGGLCPVFAWLAEPERYVAVDGVGIACRGAVHSVILVHRGPLTALRRVRLDGASRSSANLVRVLLAEYHNARPEFVEMPAPATGRERVPQAGEGLLLIGDAANAFRRCGDADVAVLDLGSEWLRVTGLPFVFALWLLRRNAPGVADFGPRLRAWREANRTRLPAIAARYGGEEREFALCYLRDCIRFEIGPREKAGLRRYGELLAQHGLIPAPPKRLRWV